MRDCYKSRAAVEREFHQWLIENQQTSNDRVLIGLGDDAAAVDFGAATVVTSDSIADQVHFDATIHDLKNIGHKAIAVSLSDIAAMGGRPIALTVDFFLPRDLDFNQLKNLFTSMAATASVSYTHLTLPTKA